MRILKIVLLKYTFTDNERKKFFQNIFCFLKNTTEYPIFSFYLNIYISNWPWPDMG